MKSIGLKISCLFGLGFLVLLLIALRPEQESSQILQGEYFIDGALGVLEESLSPEQILSQHRSDFKTIDPNVIFVDLPHPVWFLFRLNASSGPQVLSYPNPFAFRADFFVRRPGGDFSWLGRDGLKVNREGAAALTHLYPAFTFDASDQPTEIMMRIDTPHSQSHRFLLWRKAGFSHYSQLEAIFLASLLGIIFTAMLHNLLLFLTTYKQLYLIYSLFSINVLICQLGSSGFGSILFDHTFLKSLLLPRLAAACGTFAAMFVIPYILLIFEIDKKSFVYRCLIVMFWFFLALGLFILVLPRFGLMAVPAVNILVFPIVIVCYSQIKKAHVPAYVFTAAWLCVGSATVLVALMMTGVWVTSSFIVIHSSPISLSIEAVLFSWTVGDKIRSESAAAAQTIAALNEDLLVYNSTLEEMVDEKTEAIRSILDNIPIGIFSISDPLSLALDPARSRSLALVWGLPEGQQADINSFLLSRSQLNDDQIAQIQACLAAAIGHDEINFLLNEGHLPRELKIQLNGREQSVELDWSVRLKSDSRCVQSILVSLRDATDLRTFQEKARNQADELSRIETLLAISHQKYQEFESSVAAFIQENRGIVGDPLFLQREHRDPMLRVLRINWHTIKGGARSLGFVDMALLAHEAEEHLHSRDMPIEVLFADADQLEELFFEYSRLSHLKLNRQDRDLNQIAMDKIQLQHLVDTLSAGKMPAQEAIRGLMGLAYRDLQTLFEEAAQRLADLAQDLKKPVPLLQSESLAGLYLSSEAYEVLSDCLIHLLGNIMDHGLESAEERLRMAKPAAGKVICSQFIDAAQDLVLRIGDDGRGLDIARIRAIGIAKGLLVAGDSSTPAAIAALIFAEGFSTANQLSGISGRGVGMSAIRGFLQNLGGDIGLELLGDTAADRVAFRYKMTIPAGHFKKFL